MRIKNILLALTVIFFAGCSQGPTEHFVCDKDVIAMYYDRSDYPMKDGEIDYDSDEWGSFDYVQEYYIVSAKTGEKLSDISFRHLTPFTDGIAIATDENGMSTYVGKDGKRIINEEFKEASIFSEGIAWVLTQDSEIWAIDKSGKRLFMAEGAFDAHAFYKGLAVYHDEDDNTTIVDKKGNVVFKRDAYGGAFVVDGLITMMQEDGEESETGLMNMKGEFVVEPKYYTVGSGLYEAESYIDFLKKDRIVVSQEDGEGLIDRTGKVIISPQYSFILPDGDNFLVHDYKSVNDSTGEMKIFWVDKNGNSIFSAKYESAMPFGNSKYAAVSVDDYKWGLIDKKGKWFIEPSDEYRTFDSPDANGLIVATDAGGSTGLINLKKEIVIPLVYDSIVNLEGTDRYIVCLDGKFGLVDSKGKMILEPEYAGYASKGNYEGDGIKTSVYRSYDFEGEEDVEAYEG